MRIKLFEAFNTDDYYTIVDQQTWYELMNNTIDIRGYYNRIKNSIHEDYYLCKLMDQVELVIIIVPYSEKGLNINIIRTDDEWFYVRINKYPYINNSDLIVYKCDQIEGVMKLLKDLNIIKTL
jgi:hypothetical protein